jgi:hypothetical protein
MKIIASTFIVITLTACGPSPVEKEAEKAETVRKARLQEIANSKPKDLFAPAEK